MDAFTRDLAKITSGHNADRYLDDAEFNYAVFWMAGRGHPASRAVDALREWIARTPMWTCPECERRLDESYSECPICEVPNPSVVWGEAVVVHDSPSE